MKREDLVGKSVREFVGEAAYQRAKPWLDRAFAGERVSFEQEAPYPTGTRHIHVDYIPDKDPHDGKVLGVITLVSDISERVRIEKVQKDAQEYLEEFFRQAPMPIGMLEGPKHRYLVANKAFEEMVGRKVVGKEVLEVFSEEEAGGFVELLDDVYRTGRPRTAKEIRLPLPDEHGNLVEQYLNISYHPFRKPTGEVRGVLALHQLVTDEVRARKVLEESEAKIQEIASAMPQIVWTARPDGHVDWFNDRYYEFTGKSRDSHWDDDTSPVHPEDRDVIAKTWATAREKEIPYEVEHRFRSAVTGEYRWFIARGLPIKDSDGRISKWIGTNTEIHEQKLLQIRLEEETMLRERFVAALSHDLRTPLTAAKLSSQLIVRKAHDGKIEELSKKVSNNLTRMEDMISDLLDAGRVRAGEPIPLNLDVCDLELVLGPVEASLKEIYGNRIRFVPASEPVIGCWDKRQIQRAVENLVNNAAKYGTPDSPIKISFSQTAAFAKICVHNRGAPIPEVEQKNLFDLYRRSESARQGGQKGWGIGLTLVAAIAKAHRGQVELVSTEAAGTTFCLKLPMS